MKKFILFAIFISMMSLSLETFSQDIGIRGGFQSAGTWNDGEQVDNSLGAFYVGVFKNTKFGLGSLLTLNYGLEYMQNGHQADDNNYRKIDYLSLPIGLRVKLGPIYAQGGVNGNFKIGENYLVNGTDVLNDNNKTSSFDLPAHIGLGFKLLMINIEGRYHYGLLDVNNGNRNSYLQIGAGISF
jgi:hypothetical protein